MELFELGGVQVETIMALPEIQRFQAFKVGFWVKGVL